MRERKFMLVTPVKMKTPVKKLGFVSDLQGPSGPFFTH